MKPSTIRQSFQRSLTAAGRRWRNRIALQGLFVVIAGLALASTVAVPYMDASHFAPATVGVARVLVYLLLLALVLTFIVARVPRSRDRQRLVEYLEPRDRAPAHERDTLLLTALQMDARDVDAPLEQRLYERAAAACDDPHGRTRADRTGLRRAASALIALACIVIIALLMLGEGARHGVKLLLVPWRDAQHGMPYRIAVQPGDTAVRERADVAINARTRGFVPHTLTLVHRGDGEARWSRTPMQAAVATAEQVAGVSTATGPVNGEFSTEVLAVAAPFEYYLEGGNVRSAIHRVRVRWLPRAERIDHVYRYPRYTGIADRRVESATEITAVTGTTVEVRVLPHVAAADNRSSVAEVHGELVLDGSKRRPMVRDGDMLTASLSVDEATRYRIEMRADHADAEIEMVAVTPDHGVNALADAAPVVTLVRPRSDTRVTSVEEMAVQVRADDDVSLRQVELVYSINGEPEEVVALTSTQTQTPASVTGTHTLYLEERALKPGDVISYHARASDGVVSRTAVTDIQFMEVRPFDRDYRRGRSGGRGGGGGGAGGRRNEQSLAAQQRDLVVALFRLARDSTQLPAEEQALRLTTLSDAQRRIRGRVEAIVRRIKGRAVVQNTPGYVVMLEVMPKAITAMTRVEALLAVPDAEQSLPSAREALAHLQRADAAFREVQVASQQGGGGGGGRADSNDLSRLFELEMDRFRNRYSQVQRAQAPQRQRQIDESLDKLKELARRQREEIERARRRAERPRGNNANANDGSRGASGGAATQQALAKALDELLRQLERLSREQPSAAMDSARQAMQQAAQSMRQSMQPAQSQSGAQSESRSGARSDTQRTGQQGTQQTNGSGGAREGTDSAGPRGAQAAREALERLDAARRALAGDSRDQASRALRQAQQRAESLVRQQALVEQRLRGGGDSEPRGEVEPSGAGDQAERRAQAPRAEGDHGPSAGGAHDDQRARHERSDSSNAERDEDIDDDDDGKRRSVDGLKARMQADAQLLRAQLDRIAAGTETGAQVQRPVRRAAEVMREEDVEGRLRFSREQLAAGESYGAIESSIAEALERVREQVAQAAQAAARASASRDRQSADRGTGQRGGLAGGQVGIPGAERLREMMRELAELRDRSGRGFGGGRGGAVAGVAGPGGRSRDDLRGLAGDLARFEGGSFGPVASNFDPAGDLRTLIDGIEALAAQSSDQGTQISDALLDALARVERLVKAEAEVGQSALPTGRDARMPSEYRALVEAYYRRLSAGEERAQP